MNRLRRAALIFTLLCFAMMFGFVILNGVDDIRRNTLAVSSAIEDDQFPSQAEAFLTARQQLRSLQKAQLNDIAHDAETDPELAAMAQRQLLDLCAREEHELTLEGILKMRGYDTPVVSVHKDCVNVLLQCEIVTQQESSVILDLVCRQTGADAGNVKIIPIN